MFHPGLLLSFLTLKIVNINAWFAPAALFKVNIKALLSWQPVWFAALIMSRWRTAASPILGGVSPKKRGLGVVDLTGRFGGSHATPGMLVKKINHTTTPILGVVGGGSARIGAGVPESVWVVTALKLIFEYRDN